MVKKHFLYRYAEGAATCQKVALTAFAYTGKSCFYDLNFPVERLTADDQLCVATEQLTELEGSSFL